MNFTKQFYAVMRGMRGDEIASNREFGGVNRFSVLNTLEQVGNMERGESRFYSVGTMVGIVNHNDADTALEWARGTHDSQKPGAYMITRTSRGWRVESIY